MQYRKACLPINLLRKLSCDIARQRSIFALPTPTLSTLAVKQMPFSFVKCSSTFAGRSLSPFSLLIVPLPSLQLTTVTRSRSSELPKDNLLVYALHLSLIASYKMYPIYKVTKLFLTFIFPGKVWHNQLWHNFTKESIVCSLWVQSLPKLFIHFQQQIFFHL